MTDLKRILGPHEKIHAIILEEMNVRFERLNTSLV